MPKHGMPQNAFSLAFTTKEGFKSKTEKKTSTLLKSSDTEADTEHISSKERGAVHLYECVHLCIKGREKHFQSWLMLQN